MEDTTLTHLDTCPKNELALVPSGGLALQRVPSMPSAPQWSHMATLPSAVKLSRLPCLPPNGMSESPLVFLSVNSRCSTGDGGKQQITISGQGLQYLFQGLSNRGITLQPLEEGLPRCSVARTLPAAPERASVLLPCSRADACKPTVRIAELDNVTRDIVEPVQCISETNHGCVTANSPLRAVLDSPLLDDATVPAGQTVADTGFEMYHSTASNDCQQSQVKSQDKAVRGYSNSNETSPAISGKIIAKSPLETVVLETECSCDVSFSQSRLSDDIPASGGTIDTTLAPTPSPYKIACSEVPESSADDGPIPQSALVQCPPSTPNYPAVTSSDPPPQICLGEQMIVSVAKGLFEVASMSAKEPALGPVKPVCPMQDENTMTEGTGASLVLAERETQLVQMDDSDEELELPAGAPAAPGVVVIPPPPPLPVTMHAMKRSLPSAGEVAADTCAPLDRCADDFNLGDLLTVPPSSDKLVFGEHIPLAVTPADGAVLDLKSCPPLQSGPESAHGDTQTLPAATVCKRTVRDVCQHAAPSPKKLKSSAMSDDREAEKEGVGLRVEMVGVGEETKIDAVGVPTWSGCCEPPVAVHEGDFPYPAALPKEAAQLSTFAKECGVPDEETDDETDSDADENFTCLPPVQDNETAFHIVPDQTLANKEMEASPLYYVCPAPKDVGVLDRPAATASALESVEMHSFENGGNTHYAHVQIFAGSSRAEVSTGRSAFNLSKPRLRVGLSRHARVAPLHRNYKRQQ